MESEPRPTTIYWKSFFSPTPNDNFPLPHSESDATVFCWKVNARFKEFRNNIRYRKIWPHGTSRGVSRQARESLKDLRRNEDTPWLSREEEKRPITSIDVVKHFIFNGSWATGVCEMKQKWYPAQLTPRTYFAQGGTAIRASCYLRNFFNDFTDTYYPTERHARVDGSRLVCPEGGHFVIYDLTSFTSNFHEQKEFLRSMADFFRGTIVFLVGHGLSLQEASLGDLIDDYCTEINDLPEYEFNKGILDLTMDSITFIHHVAGFLGVPGNLATCTLAHGVAVGSVLGSTDQQSTAGDDGNVGVKDEDHESLVIRTVKLLGDLNQDKVSSTKDTKQGSYLKRPFKQIGERGKLVERIDYPLLGSINLMVSDDPRFLYLATDRSKLRKSIASSIARFIRKLFEFTQGEYFEGELHFILSFLNDAYSKAALPQSGMVRKMYGSSLDAESFKIDAAVVFPLHGRYLLRDPDQLLTEEFLPWVVEVPASTDEIISFQYGEAMCKGDTFHGRNHSTLNKLVKLGFLEREESERICIVGEEARKHFRRLKGDDTVTQEYIYTCLVPLSPEQLISTGLVRGSGADSKRSFERRTVHGKRSFEEYQDLDPITLQDTSGIDLSSLY